MRDRETYLLERALRYQLPRLAARIDLISKAIAQLPESVRADSRRAALSLSVYHPELALLVLADKYEAQLDAVAKELGTPTAALATLKALLLSVRAAGLIPGLASVFPIATQDPRAQKPLSSGQGLREAFDAALVLDRTGHRTEARSALAEVRQLASQQGDRFLETWALVRLATYEGSALPDNSLGEREEAARRALVLLEEARGILGQLSTEQSQQPAVQALSAMLVRSRLLHAVRAKVAGSEMAEIAYAALAASRQERDEGAQAWTLSLIGLAMLELRHYKRAQSAFLLARLLARGNQDYEGETNALVGLAEAVVGGAEGPEAESLRAHYHLIARYVARRAPDGNRSTLWQYLDNLDGSAEVIKKQVAENPALEAKLGELEQDLDVTTSMLSVDDLLTGDLNLDKFALPIPGEAVFERSDSGHAEPSANNAALRGEDAALRGEDAALRGEDAALKVARVMQRNS